MMCVCVCVCLIDQSRGAGALTGAGYHAEQRHKARRGPDKTSVGGGGTGGFPAAP